MLLTNTTIDNIARFISLLVIFGIVLAATYFSTKFIANVSRGRTRTGNMDIIETIQVTQNKHLQIVKVGSKYIVIAVCKDTITYLTELNEDELEIKETENAEAINFAGVLEKVKEKLPKKK